MKKRFTQFWVILGMLISCVCQAEQPKSEHESSPFTIPFNDKENLTPEDYAKVQDEIRKIDITPTLERLYPYNLGYSEFDDFRRRTTKGIVQGIIDETNGLLPETQLIKIGKGGDNCVVSKGSYNGKYAGFLSGIQKALEDSGFNGYFLYQRGGFPNPTGKESKFVAVPYSFKIFMMLEAQKLGFNKVLWIDSAALPMRDPTPIFELIDKDENFVNYWGFKEDTWRYILPATRQILLDETGYDTSKERRVSMIIFGLKMNGPRTQKFIESYYKLVEMGTPFLSCYPEEYVISALLSQPELGDFGKKSKLGHLIKIEESDSLKEKKKAQDKGFYFYLLPH